MFSEQAEFNAISVLSEHVNQQLMCSVSKDGANAQWSEVQGTMRRGPAGELLIVTHDKKEISIGPYTSVRNLRIQQVTPRGGPHSVSPSGPQDDTPPPRHASGGRAVSSALAEAVGAVSGGAVSAVAAVVRSISARRGSSPGGLVLARSTTNTPTSIVLGVPSPAPQAPTRMQGRQPSPYGRETPQAEQTPASLDTRQQEQDAWNRRLHEELRRQHEELRNQREEAVRREQSFATQLLEHRQELEHRQDRQTQSLLAAIGSLSRASPSPAAAPPVAPSPAPGTAGAPYFVSSVSPAPSVADDLMSAFRKREEDENPIFSSWAVLHGGATSTAYYTLQQASMLRRLPEVQLFRKPAEAGYEDTKLALRALADTATAFDHSSRAEIETAFADLLRDPAAFPANPKAPTATPAISSERWAIISCLIDVITEARAMQQQQTPAAEMALFHLALTAIRMLPEYRKGKPAENTPARILAASLSTRPANVRQVKAWTSSADDAANNLPLRLGVATTKVPVRASGF